MFERATEPRESGAGIGIMPNGVQALDALGLGAPLRARATPLEAGIIRDRLGRPLLSVDHDTLLRHTGDPLVVVPRRWLHTMLLGAAGTELLHAGRPVRELRGSGDGVEIDGYGRFDAVIAADGANSRLRAALFPAFPGLRGSGEYAARAIVPAPAGVTPVPGELLDRRTGERFGCMPMADGTVYWYATWPADRLTAPADVPALAARPAGGLASECAGPDRGGRAGRRARGARPRSWCTRCRRWPSVGWRCSATPRTR